MISIYPKPDRSDHTPNFTKTGDNDVLDIGWNEGVLTDGRPYRAECWAQDQATYLTFFFPSSGIESLDKDECAALLERERLVEWGPERRIFLSLHRMSDSRGTQLWTASAVVGDDDSTFMTRSIPLQKY